VWKRTDKWKPARTGTASGGYSVEHSVTGGIGFAKTTFAHRERLAADLAARVGVMVPTVELDQVEGVTQMHAVSVAHGKESVDIPLLRARLADKFNSPEVQNAIKGASGVLPFYLWIADTDVKDDHLVVADDGAGGYVIAAIDFAQSLAWQADDGGPVAIPTCPPCLNGIVDKAVVAATVSNIESVTNEEIAGLVNSLPDDLIQAAEKNRLIHGLSGRRDKIRQAMKDQGWLP
jgi:hypothetical protein